MWWILVIALMLGSSWNLLWRFVTKEILAGDIAKGSHCRKWWGKICLALLSHFTGNEMSLKCLKRQFQMRCRITCKIPPYRVSTLPTTTNNASWLRERNRETIVENCEKHCRFLFHTFPATGGRFINGPLQERFKMFQKDNLKQGAILGQKVFL